MKLLLWLNGTMAAMVAIGLLWAVTCGHVVMVTGVGEFVVVASIALAATVAGMHTVIDAMSKPSEIGQ